MAYYRVIPRDLFNEADLLKCYGRLWILLENRPNCTAVLDEGDGEPFDVQQDESGQLTVANLPFTIRGEEWRLIRPLNSRNPWPLYAETDEQCERVFTDAGELSPEFLALIQA